ncbi:MAG: alkane 1-monooxygenase, partial [Rhodobacteraceae bacterium]|nr:alkane 1-monooxygenase [Paracoccaceae bacterium]
MNPHQNLFPFFLITLAPVLLLFGAGFFGGGWVWLALGYMTLLAVTVDLVAKNPTPASDPDARFLAANLLSVILAFCHFGLLALMVGAVSGATGLTVSSRFGLFFAAGLFFGQVSNSNAHELIHRPAALHWLGVLVYTSLLFGHHASAHNKVHHLWAASAKDPNSARMGEGFYRFSLRAWPGSFSAGLKAEHNRSLNPYFIYIGGAGLTLALAALLAGPAGLGALIGLAGYAQIQLLLSDYVQ